MTCKLNGLFSTGEDFDDEDLLGTDWCVPPPAAPCDGQTAAPGLRQLPSSSCPPSRNNTEPNLPPPRGHVNPEGSLKPCVAQDDFDDWDVDLADLNESEDQVVRPPSPPPAAPVQQLRPPAHRELRTTLPDRTLAAHKPCGSSNRNLPPRAPQAAHVRSPVPRPAVLSAPPQSPGVFTPSPVSRTPSRAHWTTPGPSAQGRGLFETAFSAPSPSSSSCLNAANLSPHPLHTPVVTNRLVQLVSASNKLPQKRPRSELQRPRTRRFPGPAGVLPQQPQGQRLDDIVVPAPHTPAHSVMARQASQASSSQTEEDEFSSGAWAVMKAEMGLDERNPSCFLHSYSVVMVLRKAALKQLVKNKVPNMAVLLKSIIHTHNDAKAVFKDPTGEMQGTLHRRLLEDRAEELKVGAILLLKQVGVFSPSHRNHYLNVTPNNLLRVYSPDGVSLSSVQLPPLVLAQMSSSPTQPPTVLREPVSRMHLLFDEEEDEGQEGERCTEGATDSKAPTDTGGNSSRGPQQSSGNPAAQDEGWDADDDLDELLGELPEDTCNL
ncbi:uncharacterized protein C17orf53 homolog [Echeneis naucrates]|uniref:Homologous recombination OB-fold protein OB-fold domain-containing protein n=1 Tax=Echeneis naucrates TaxID=173247 RepID=A0A665U3V3_ECHNA|nr:uncharacterized protein C17orf53 homolog [Echeneis naucrates]